MPKPRAGIGAKCSILTRFIHPSEHVRIKFPNLDKAHRTDGVLIGHDQRTVSRRSQDCYLFRSDDYPNIEMYAVVRYVKIIEEGAEADLFIPTVPPNPVSTAIVTIEGEDATALTTVPPITGGYAEDIIAMRAEGVYIDDDNEPAEENIPKSIVDIESPFENEWGYKGVCYRRKDGHTHRNASCSMPRETWQTMSPSDWFLLFFPMSYVTETMLPAMNDALEKGRPKIMLWEYVRWLGIWTLLATTDGHDRKAFFERQKPSEDERFEGPPFRLGDIMSGRRFNEILSVHKTYGDPFPAFKDPYHPIRAFFDSWNEQMKENFNPSWVVCLDESMSKWTCIYTCPGFVFCPRKPWPMGNEYHTIACGLSSIIFHMEMVEGKDRPKELPPLAYNDQGGKTVALLLRMTKCIWNTGRLVILDSGFCVLKGIVALAKKGVFASALIKKRRYWPKYINGEEIKEHFKDKKVSDVDAWPGMLDSVPFYVFSMKEPDYIMSIMSTYGTLNESENSTKRIYKNENGQEVTTEFFYTEVFNNHFQYRHVVDDNNNNRMQPISIEETWATKDWNHRPYAYAIGVSMVNAQRGYEYLGGHEKISNLQFRRMLAKGLIYNNVMPRETYSKEKDKRETKKRRLGFCKLISLKPNTCFSGKNIVPCKGRYNQYTCVCRAMRVRTYCECSPGFIRCSKCYVTHCIEVERDK